MKKLVQVLMVVVALISGFPQANGQECLNVTFRNHWHDSSYHLTNKQLEYLVRRAEWVINKNNFPFDLVIQIDTKRITTMYNFATPTIDFAKKGTNQVSSFWRYLESNLYPDSNITFNLICIRHDLYPFYIAYPAVTNRTMCTPVGNHINGSNPLYLIMNDSFSLDFYANCLASQMLGSIGAGYTAFDNFLNAKNTWKTGDSASAITYENILMNGKWSCLPKGTGCKTLKPSPIVSIDEISGKDKTKVTIYDRKIINDNLCSITVYDLTGRPVKRSSERVIDLHSIPSGIFLVQEDQKIPIKHFFY